MLPNNAPVNVPFEVNGLQLVEVELDSELMNDFEKLTLNNIPEFWHQQDTETLASR